MSSRLSQNFLVSDETGVRTFCQGTAHGLTDSAANRDSTWRPRDYEAQVLVALLRLSRLTVLYGAEGVGKTTLLKTGVLPLLRPRADDRNLAQDENPRVVVPFPDRHTGDGTVDRGAQVTIVFDRWGNAPLTALQAQILDALPIENTRMAAPLPSLADNFAAWNEDLGVRFFIILDCFEQHLRAPFDRAGIAEFDDEFVRMVNEPILAANFLLSVRDDAEPLMNRFRERISGFGDAYLRLPSLHHVTAPSLAPGARTHRPAAAGTSPIAASETLTTRPSKPPKPPFVLPAALTTGPLPAGGAAPGEAVPAPPIRTELRRPVRSPGRISLAAIVAGFAIGAGAGIFAVYGYQRTSTWQTASSAKGVAPATAHTADLPTVPVPPATLADHLVPPPPSERTSAVHESAPPPRSPTPIKSAKAASLTPKVAARIAPPQVDSVSPARASVVRAVPIAATVVIDWQTAMNQELDVCRQKRIFARVVCTEEVRWKRCAPNRWNTIPECAAGNTQVTRSD